VIRFANVLLDLDGTLTDPFDGIAASICYALERMGFDAPAEEELRAAIGPPLRQSFSSFLKTNDADRIEEALRLYRERYSTTGLFENQVYAGVPEMLASLIEAGCRLFVATSKPRVFAQKIVEHFDLARHFAGVYGSDLDGRLDNKKDLICFILAAEGLSADRAVMVGDRSHDVVGAKANAVCAVGVMWGYGSRDELEMAGAEVICQSPNEVVRILVES
jgi:phosphoglycolate phosphatase